MDDMAGRGLFEEETKGRQTTTMIQIINPASFNEVVMRLKRSIKRTLES